MSAYIGQPPQTDEDYWVVRNFLHLQGKTNADPTKGVKIPPAKPPPNVYHFESRAPGIITGSAMTIVIMVFITVSRLIVRWRRKSGQKFGADDWMIIPALIFSVLYPAIQIYTAMHAGNGRHLYDVTYHQYDVYNLITSIGKIVFYFAVATIKMSITLFNMRLTGLSSPRWMKVHWGFFSFLVCFMLTIFFTIIFQCDPPKAKFSLVAAGKLPHKAKCYSDSLQGTILSTIHVLTDVCLLSVPIIVLWKTRIDWKTKARLYFVFCIGGMSFIASFMRLIVLSHVHTDTLYNFTGVLTWAYIDLTFGLSAASLPVLSTLLPRSLRNATKHGSRQTATKNYGQISGPLSSSNTRPHAKDSQEGIVRQDEIELEYSARDGHADDNSDLDKKPQANVHAVSGINGKTTSWSDPYTLHNSEKR
ncbi:MAG: hypothetical protein M1835_006383 [Candelina submexicana]|nr:MAG: hypothetical protein M1835_006383 [Candelina submexicana]